MSDTVNGSSCSYTTLNNYNSSTAGSLGSPAYSATTVKGYYVVPNYSAPGYNALTHGNDTPTCSGYFNVTSAYGANAANCNTQYSQMPCGNSMMKENFARQNYMYGATGPTGPTGPVTTTTKTTTPTTITTTTPTTTKTTTPTTITTTTPTTTTTTTIPTLATLCSNPKPDKKNKCKQGCNIFHGTCYENCGKPKFDHAYNNKRDVVCKRK